MPRLPDRQTLAERAAFETAVADHLGLDRATVVVGSVECTRRPGGRTTAVRWVQVTPRGQLFEQYRDVPTAELGSVLAATRLPS